MSTYNVIEKLEQINIKRLLGSLYHYLWMQTVVDKQNHQGAKRNPGVKGVVKHAKKHHKKYIWGAAGFFGLFKLFSFFIVTILSLTTIIAANIPNTMSIAIPATTIDIQEGKTSIQFDMSEVNIGEYSNIQNIDLRITVETQKTTLERETLRSTTTASEEETNTPHLLTIQLFKKNKNTRTIDPQNISSILEQILKGNTIVYVLPQENITLQDQTLFMEFEVTQPQTGGEEEKVATRDDDFGFTITDDDKCENEITTTTDQSTVYLCSKGTYRYSTTDTRISSISEKDILEQNWQGDYTNNYQFNVSGEGKTTIYAQYKYTTDKDQEYRSKIVAASLIVRKTSQSSTVLSTTIANGDTLHLNNKYRIVKANDTVSSLTLNSTDTASTLTVSEADWDGMLSAPALISAGTKKANKEENGLPKGFVPIATYEVGSDTARLSLSGTSFSVSLLVTDERSLGKNLNIYSSQDGITWTDEKKTCTVAADQSCTFSSSHLTLFTLGSITRDNLQFVNQRFRDAGPTPTQIIDAFFGIGSNPSAYTTHWTGSCRPTNIVYRSPGTIGATSLAANTIYILNSGNYIQNGTITINGNCSAIVGRGNVKISTQGSINPAIYAIAKSGSIIDNIYIKNEGTTLYGIFFTGQQNATFNDIQINKYVHHGIYLASSINALINNSQAFNNIYGWYILNAKSITINNGQSYNNTNNGIGAEVVSGLIINNTQLYNNTYYGVFSTNTLGLIIHNSQIYNNAYGIATTNVANIWINNTKIFNNSQAYSFTNSNGIYYGTNTIYPTANLAGWATGGNNPGGLGWTAGTISTTNLGFSCNFVTQVLNGSNTSLYTTNDCSNIQARTARDGEDIVTYEYGNKMLSGQYVLRQTRPVGHIGGILALSSIPYHGHRFIGEYDDPSRRDKNGPIILFTGETPVDGFNLANVGFYTLRAYIYESNLSLFHLSDRSGTNQISNTPYDSSLIFMANFDNVKEIGETNTLVKDLSLNKDYGVVNSATWATNGKRHGAYNFNGSTDFISTENKTSINKLTIQLRFKTNASNRGVIFGQSNAIPPTTPGAYTPTILMQADGKIRTELWVGNITSAVTTNAYNDNQWHQITLVGNEIVQSIYIDGILVESHTTATSIDNSRRKKSTIGVGYDTTNRGGSANTWKYFSGQIDEPRVRNRALSVDEIQQQYNSNLSAKADHREYIKNYTDITTRPYSDNYNYSIDYIDSNYNGGEITRGLKKERVCTRNSRWNNDGFMSGSFWTHSPAPTECEIIAALYGTGTDGSDLTAYTSNWTGRAGECNYSNMSVVYLTGGTDKIPSTLAANTIYVLASGTYIQTSSPSAVTYSTCSAIIGQTGNIKIYSVWSIGDMIGAEQIHNTIADNIQIDGYNNGGGGSHTKNDMGFYFKGTSNISINNSIVQHNEGSLAGITFNGTKNGQITNSKISDNTIGIFNLGEYNILSGLQIFGNDVGIIIGGSYSTLHNIQTYANNGAGIFFAGENNNTTLNTIQSFNNDYGIQTDNDGGNKDYISVNNSQIYNNTNDGLLLYRTFFFTINNSHIYNNGNNGIYFAGSNNEKGLMNNVFVYNNGGYGIFSYHGNHTRYGLTTTFNNGILGIGVQFGSLSPGNSSTYVYLGRTGGTTDTSQCINCSRTTNPRTPGPGYDWLINTTTYPKCNLRGNNSSRTATGDLSYTYGISLTGQKAAVVRVDTTLTTASLPYSTAKHVAEISKIATYTNQQCSCAGHTYRRDNDNFITPAFWNNNPDYCDIIAAIYGRRTDGIDLTAYTTGWISSRAGQCNVENMQVIFKTGGTNKLPSSLGANKIYVLNTGIYLNPYTIQDGGKCSFILGSGNVTLASTVTLSSIYEKRNDFGGIDNIMVDGGSGNISNGIYINHTINNTIHKTSSFSNQGNGFLANEISNTLFQDIFAYKNGEAGININTQYQQKEITINNGMAYNNRYGIYGSGSNQLAINNFQVFNNNEAGIYINSNNDTIFNNMNIYNNANYGIVGNVAKFAIIDISLYNNGSAIQVEPMGGTKYYNTLTIFNNGEEDFSQITQGDSSDFNSISVANGQIGGGDVSRNIMTNPYTSNYLLPFSATGFEGLRGNKTFSRLQPAKYSYGKSMKRQTIPIKYTSSNPTAGGGLIFSGEQYIGSNITSIAGDLIGLPSITGTKTLSLNADSYSALVSKYSLFGNIVSDVIGQTKNTTTSITLSPGLPINRVIAQFFDPNGYFAMHLENKVELLPPCLAGWDNDKFIDATFRAQNPTDENIICAIYGSGKPDQTAYTKTWPNYEGNCSLDYGETVKYAVDPETEPLGGVDVRTIYIFPEGEYNVNGSIELKECTAFISSGSTSIMGNGHNTALRTYNVIDNIDIDGGGSANDGIVKFFNDYNGFIGNTIHAMDIYSGSLGIYVENSEYNLIDSVNVFGNNNGIYINSSENTSINNSQIYNNQNNGIDVYGSNYTTINNTQIYNNSQHGIYDRYDSSYTTINNTQIYNNSKVGIVNEANHEIISDIVVYHNGNCGYDGNNYGNNAAYYYDQNHFIENNPNICNSNLQMGGNHDYPDSLRAGGELYDQGEGEGEGNGTSRIYLSWDYFTNPKDGNGHYLLNFQESDFSSFFGQQSFDATAGEISYSYGSKTSPQQQPVVWDSSNSLLITGLSFDSDEYIGGNTKIYNGDLQIGTMTTSPTTVTGTANPTRISGYNLYGYNLDTPYLGININTATSIGFTQGDGSKKIITQIYSPSYFATHFETSTTVDTTPPTFSFNDVTVNETNPITMTITAIYDELSGIPAAPYNFSLNGGASRSGWQASSGFALLTRNEAATIQVRAKVRDTLGNESAIALATGIWNNILPTATGVSVTGYECTTITNTANASDPGGTIFTYQWYANATCTAPIAGTGLNWSLNNSNATTGNYSYTATDNNAGASACTGATFVWYNTLITANNFVYATNIGSTAKTFSWLTGSSAAAGSCETITATVLTQGSKGTCTIAAGSGNITYTPNPGQSGQDICTIRITDGDSYIDRTVTVNNIYSIAPIIYFIGSTPTGGLTISDNNFKPQLEMITTGGLNTFSYIFNDINYPYYDSGLLLMMNFDNVATLGETAGVIIKDFSQYGNNGTGINGPTWTGNGWWNGGYVFDGINDYIQMPNLGIANGSFTIAGRVKPASNATGTFIGWDASHKISITSGGKLLTQFGSDFLSSGSINEINTWTYILYMYNSTNNTEYFYINGRRDSQHTPSVQPTWNAAFKIGQYDGTNDKFKGTMDEIRIRKRAITSGEILQMRRSNFQKYGTDTWRFTDDRQCMGTGTYNYSGYVLNNGLLPATTGRANLISFIKPFVTPTSYFMGETGSSAQERTLTGQFTGYFTVDDRQGSTDWYSTIQLPLIMTGVNYATNKIINDGNNIKFKAIGLTVTGSNTGNLVYINPDFANYTGFTAPKQYIQRDYAQGYSCPSGIYGNKPYISIDIPGYQNPDIYSGTITIDISE